MFQQTAAASNVVNAEGVVHDVIVIGGSAGAHAVVKEVLAQLPADLPAIIGLVIHRGVSPSDWSLSLGRHAKLRVQEGVNGEVLRLGTVYVAPSDAHMRFEDGRVALDQNAKECFTRPAVNPLFVSAANAYGSRVVGLILTGAGSDGTDGMIRIWRKGGISLVQKPSESQQSSMPDQSIRYDHVDAALAVEEMADRLVVLAHGGRFEAEPFVRSLAFR